MGVRKPRSLKLYKLVILLLEVIFANYKSIFAIFLLKMSKTPCRFKDRLECKTDLSTFKIPSVLLYNYKRKKKKRAYVAE